jgi:hypothetical protein
LALFDDDAMFIVPGSTSVSGDHDKAAFRTVLDTVAKASDAGAHRQEMICRYEGDSGVVAIFDTFVVAGEDDKYHSVHEWIFRDGRPHVWMLYVHEYERFASVWS